MATPVALANGVLGCVNGAYLHHFSALRIPHSALI